MIIVSNSSGRIIPVPAGSRGHESMLIRIFVADSRLAGDIGKEVHVMIKLFPALPLNM